MQTDDSKETLERGGVRAKLVHLGNCSRTSVASYRLRRLNEAANMRKRAIELMRASIELQAEALAAQWVEDYGEAIVAGDVRPCDLPPRS